MRYLLPLLFLLGACQTQDQPDADGSTQTVAILTSNVIDDGTCAMQACEAGASECSMEGDADCDKMGTADCPMAGATECSMKGDADCAKEDCAEGSACCKQSECEEE